MQREKAFSIRSYIQYLEENFPNELLSVDDETSTEYETTAYYLALKHKNPVILFKKLRGFPDFSLITNIFGSENRLANIAGFKDTEEFIKRWDSVMNDSTKNALSISESSPFSRVLVGEDADLTKLPIPTHYALDGSNSGIGRYITGGLSATSEEVPGEAFNLSFARIQAIGRNSFAFDAGSHGHFWAKLNSAIELNLKVDFDIIIGANPIYYILAASFIDNEYYKASSIFNMKFVKGVLNDIPIPEDAEIVLEAQFLPKVKFNEGPFAEYTGYMGYDSTQFVGKVKSILMRKNPIYYDIQPSNASEHINLFSLPRSSSVLNSMKRVMPGRYGYRIVWPHYGSRFLALGYTEDKTPGFSIQLGLSILGLDPLWNKIVFINDGITPLTLEASLGNLASSIKEGYFRYFRVSKAIIISSDPSRDQSGTSGKIVFVSKGLPTHRVTKNQNETVINTEMGKALISHGAKKDYDLVIVVPNSVDPLNLDEVGWAIATMVNPERDIVIKSSRVVIKARNPQEEIPAIPSEILKKIKNVYHSSS